MQKQIARISSRLKHFCNLKDDIPTFSNGTFSEFGPALRIKRQVVFPDETTTGEVEKKIEEFEGNSVDASEGRALKQTIQSVTKIDVGVQSQLLVTPGSTSIIYFDVTNLRNEPTYLSFNVQDEKRFLRSLEPRL